MTFAKSWRTAFWNFVSAAIFMIEDVIGLATLGWVENVDFLDKLKNFALDSWCKAERKENNNDDC